MTWGITGQILLLATLFKVAAYFICKSKDRGHFCLNAQLHFFSKKGRGICNVPSSSYEAVISAVIKSSFVIKDNTYHTNCNDSS